MNTSSYKYPGGDKPLTLRGGKGEFYGGNQVHITEMNSIQTEKNKYKPFQGKGLCIGNIINETPKEKTRTGISQSLADDDRRQLAASDAVAMGFAPELVAQVQAEGRYDEVDSLVEKLAEIAGISAAKFWSWSWNDDALLKLSKKKVSFKKDIVHKKITFEVDRIKHYQHYSREKIKYSNSNESYGKIKSLKKLEDVRYMKVSSLKGRAEISNGIYREVLGELQHRRPIYFIFGRIVFHGATGGIQISDYSPTRGPSRCCKKDDPIEGYNGDDEEGEEY